MNFRTFRQKDLPAATLAADHVFSVDNANGMRGATLTALEAKLAADFVADPTTFNLAPIVAGKIPSEYLPFTGALTFISGIAGGSVPATATAAGYYYVITAAGSSQTKTWAVGDWAVYNGSSGSWTQLTAATLAILGGGTGATTAAGARANLDLLSSLEIYTSASARRPRNGLVFDNSNSAKLTGAPGFALGLLDFTVSFVASLKDWSPAATHVIFSSHTTATNRVRINVASSAGNPIVAIAFDDGAGVGTQYNIAPTVTLVDGEVYNMAVTLDRDGNATLYVNGTAAGTVSIAAAAAIDIGASNATNSFSAFSFDGTLYDLRVFNRLLSAADVLASTKIGRVAYADQHGVLSAKYTSTFSAGADGWSDATSTVTGNTDGIGGENDVLLVDSAATTMARAKRTFTERLKGKKIRVKYKVYRPSSNATGVMIRLRNASDATLGATDRTPAADTWVEYDETFNLENTLGGEIRFWLLTSGAGTITAGDKFYLKDILVEYVGAIADWDFDNADPQLSTNIPDRAGVYTFTAAATTYSTRPNPQMNAQTMTIGGGAVMKKILSATATLNFPSIAAGASADLPITVTGAAVGDEVSLGLPAAPEAGIVFQGFVSATNTVTIRATNITASPIDPASATFRATVNNY